MQPSLPRGWFKWTFWQYSEKGRINGINANVDLNVFNGSLEDLYKFAGAQIITESRQRRKSIRLRQAIPLNRLPINMDVTVRELVSANPQLLKTSEQLTIPVAVAIPVKRRSVAVRPYPHKRNSYGKVW